MTLITWPLIFLAFYDVAIAGFVLYAQQKIKHFDYFATANWVWSMALVEDQRRQKTMLKIILSQIFDLKLSSRRGAHAPDGNYS
jgi:hypothetical protein